MMAARLACATAIALFVSSAIAAGPRLVPNVDPFRKPEIEAVEALPAELVAEEPKAVEMPKLRAILHSSRTTLVNLDGQLIAIGDSYLGYHVAAAGTRDVVLFANDETFVVSLDEKGKNNARDR